MNPTIVDEAVAHAISVLEGCVTKLGIRASAAEGGYDEVWARDAMIVLVGACGAGLEWLVPSLRASLETLRQHQSDLGYIPINVDARGRRATANAGPVDSNLWFVIGHLVLHDVFGSGDLLERHRDAIARAMLWTRYQDSDDDGLLESQEAAGWADLIAYRGKILYINVLYVIALRAYVSLAEAIDLPDVSLHEAAAATTVERINDLFWVDAKEGLWDEVSSPALRGEHSESRRLVQLTSAHLWSRPYYLPWVGFRDYGDWCDVLGNTLAILAGISSEDRRDRILEYFDQVGVARPYPSKVLYPPIRAGDKDWRDYYRQGGLSLPHQYQNGGIWPFVGAFHVTALVHSGRRADAAALLERLAHGVRKGRKQWEFNEWLHGVTGAPMGMACQAWSAAMYLFAHRAVETGTVPGGLRRLTEAKS